jgi:ribosomal protein L12E/L44/L45/RPP1/RPP2
MATAGSIVIDLLMNTGSFETDTQRAAKSLKSLENSAAVTGAAIGTAMVAAGTAVTALVKQSIDAMDEMSKLAQKTGTTVESISALTYAADLSGVSQEELGSAISKLTKNMSDAANGTGEAQAGFKALGISVTDASGNLKSSDAILGELADKFAGYQDGAEKTALAVNIFGKAGAQLIPLLNSGKDGLSDLSDEAKRLGLIFDQDTATAAENFNDNLSRLHDAVKGFGNSIATAVLPVLVDLTNQAVESAKTFADFTSSIKDISSSSFGSQLRADMDAVVVAFQALNALAQEFNVHVTAISGDKFDKELASSLSNLSAMLVNTGKEIDALAMGFQGDIGGIDSLFSALGLNIENYFSNAFNAVLNKAAGFVNSMSTKLSGVSQFFGGGTLPTINTAGYQPKQIYSLADSFSAGFQRNATGLGAQQYLQNLVDKQYLNGVGETGGTYQPSAPRKPSAPRLPTATDTAAAKQQIDAGQQLIDQLQKQIDLTGQLTERQKLQIQVQQGYVTFKSQADQDQAMAAADTLDLINQQNKAYDDTQKQLEKMSKVTQSTTDDMDEFTKQAARNIEDSLGDGLYDLLTGNFKDIGASFANMVARMVANAAAANLGKALFGDFAKNGQIGGWIGDLFGTNGPQIAATQNTSLSALTSSGNALSSFDGLSYAGYASGGYTGPGGRNDPAGIVHAGEFVINAASTRKLGLGFLSRLNGYADGGLVGGATPAMAAPSFAVQISNNGTPQQVQSSSARFDGDKYVISVVTSDLKRNGPISKAMKGVMA